MRRVAGRRGCASHGAWHAICVGAGLVVMDVHRLLIRRPAGARRGRNARAHGRIDYALRIGAPGGRRGGAQIAAAHAARGALGAPAAAARRGARSGRRRAARRRAGSATPTGTCRIVMMHGAADAPLADRVEREELAVGQVGAEAEAAERRARPSRSARSRFAARAASRGSRCSRSGPISATGTPASLEYFEVCTFVQLSPLAVHGGLTPA